MKNLIMWLCGYRKHRFVLFTGRKITFLSRSKREAIKKALSMEKRVRENYDKTANLIRTLKAI